MTKKSFLPFVKENGSILTDPCLIAVELSNYHQKTLKGISDTSPGKFDPVRWDEEFIMKDSPEGDLVLKISDALVLALFLTVFFRLKLNCCLGAWTQSNLSQI